MALAKKTCLFVDNAMAIVKIKVCMVVCVYSQTRGHTTTKASSTRGKANGTAWNPIHPRSNIAVEGYALEQKPLECSPVSSRVWPQPNNASVRVSSGFETR